MPSICLFHWVSIFFLFAACLSISWLKRKMLGCTVQFWYLFGIQLHLHVNQKRPLICTRLRDHLLWCNLLWLHFFWTLETPETVCEHIGSCFSSNLLANSCQFPHPADNEQYYDELDSCSKPTGECDSDINCNHSCDFTLHQYAIWGKIMEGYHHCCQKKDQHACPFWT